MNGRSVLTRSTERTPSERGIVRQNDSISQEEFLFFHRELALASDVQRASFPQHLPGIQGLTCKSLYMPAHKVGGDYYDFLRLHDNAWGIAIGDVSGKGVAAALVMANLQASLRAQALHAHADIETLMANLNHLVYEFSPAQFFCKFRKIGGA